MFLAPAAPQASRRSHPGQLARSIANLREAALHDWPRAIASANACLSVTLGATEQRDAAGKQRILGESPAEGPMTANVVACCAAASIASSVSLSSMVEVPTTLLQAARAERSSVMCTCGSDSPGCAAPWPRPAPAPRAARPPPAPGAPAAAADHAEMVVAGQFHIAQGISGGGRLGATWRQTESVSALMAARASARPPGCRHRAARHLQGVGSAQPLAAAADMPTGERVQRVTQQHVGQAEAPSCSSMVQNFASFGRWLPGHRRGCVQACHSRRGRCWRWASSCAISAGARAEAGWRRAWGIAYSELSDPDFSTGGRGFCRG